MLKLWLISMDFGLLGLKLTGAMYIEAYYQSKGGDKQATLVINSV